MSDLYEIYENTKSLKRNDVKNTEKKLEDDIFELINNKEFAFLAPYLKNNGKLLYQLLTQYIKKIGRQKAKNDPNLSMLAPVLAAMESEIKK